MFAVCFPPLGLPISPEARHPAERAVAYNSLRYADLPTGDSHVGACVGSQAATQQGHCGARGANIGLSAVWICGFSIAGERHGGLELRPLQVPCNSSLQ